jgi:DNA-binding NarL/FixJ family response regulator
MDIMMPVCDGVEGTRLIKELDKSIKVIILTTFKDHQNIEKALKNGADGYVLKDMDPHELINVIKTVKKGLSILQTDILAAVSRKFNMLNEDKNECEDGYRFSEGNLA